MAAPGAGCNETTIASAKATVEVLRWAWALGRQRCGLPNQAMGWLERPNQEHSPLLAWTKYPTTDLSGEAAWTVSAANPV